MGKDLAAYNTKMFAEQGFAKAARHVQRMGRQMVAAANARPERAEVPAFQAPLAGSPPPTGSW